LGRSFRPPPPQSSFNHPSRSKADESSSPIAQLLSSPVLEKELKGSLAEWTFCSVRPCPSMRNIAPDWIAMEAADPPSLQAQDTGELLTAIIDELRSIGSILAQQNERIEALSIAKDRAHPKEWDSVSVTVGFQCPMVSPSHLIVCTGLRVTTFGGFDIFQFHSIYTKYNIYRAADRLYPARSSNQV
jgi:hypothetical protein